MSRETKMKLGLGMVLFAVAGWTLALGFAFSGRSEASYNPAALATNSALGTPASGTLTNCTGLPVSTGISGLGTGVATALANTTNAASGVMVNGATASGTNTAGSDVALLPGAGTGTAKGGNINIKRSPSIGSGTTAQTLYDGLILVSQGKALTDNVATTVATWTLASNSSGGGTINFRIQCTNGTDFQSAAGSISVALVNKAGTYTTSVLEHTNGLAVGAARALSAGTLNITWSITAAGAVQVTADTSLTPSGTNGFVIYYTILNQGEGNVTLP